MKKYILISTSIALLVSVYLFQRVSFAAVMNEVLPNALQIIHPNTVFCINKAIRLILNDLACLIFIYAAFQKRVYLKASFYLLLTELLILLPAYLILKLSMEGTSELSSPFLSQIHRLIVNPLLMFLLIMGFVYQRLMREKP
jgi:exosortase F-associated protein